MSNRVCSVFVKLTVLSMLVVTVAAGGCSGGSGTTSTTGGTTSHAGGTGTTGGSISTAGSTTGSSGGATNPGGMTGTTGGSTSAIGGTGGGGMIATGGTGGSAATGGAAVTGGVSGTGGASVTGGTVMPTDPQSCAKATNVSECLPGMAAATISSAAGGPLLAKIAVTSGSCSASSCASGCTSLRVNGGMSNIGATCDLLVTSTDGRSQSVRLTVVQNPSPFYTCCGDPVAPYPGHWVALDPTAFSPSSVVVDFPPDAGAPVADTETDSTSEPNTASLDGESVDTGTDARSGPDGEPGIGAS